MKNKTLILKILIPLILLMCSIGLYLCYPNIQNVALKENKNDEISRYVLEDNKFYQYILDLKLKEEMNQSTDVKQYIEVSQDKYYIEAKTSLLDQIEHYQSKLFEQRDIDYLVTDNQNKNKVSNTEDDLSTINTNNDLQKKYQWYIQINYNNNGSPSIVFGSLESIQDYSYLLDSSYRNTIYDDNGVATDYTQYTSPKNITITYAVAKELQPTGTLASTLNSTDYETYFRYSLPYILGFSALITIFAFLIPISKLKEIKLFKYLAYIKFEILTFLWWTAMFFVIAVNTRIVVLTLCNTMNEFYETFGVTSFHNILTPTINIIAWMIFFSFIIFLVYMIKYLFNKGFKKYLKENTCLGWLVVHSGALIDKITNFDFKNDTNKTVLKIVLFNFAIITIISFFFVFGFFFASFYSIIIFIILKKKFDRIQDDYQVLLDATKQLSEGNFDVQIEKDVGMFNPLKDEFSHIKNGFQKAVSEEVKSQKTKTELISNVSHDLKTPLTSIITYVDLLKKNDLSEEERFKYIGVLDRNSLRLKHLIEDLFEVSKASSGDIKLNFAEVDIVSLVKQVQYECTDKLEEKNLDLRLSCTTDKIICHLDGEKTYRIFENLFMNISKYALAYTRVYIDIQENDESVEIIFKNISESEMRFNEHDIVERFTQGDESRNTSGSGLGLAIVKSFTEIQGGQFKIELDGDLFKSILIFKK